MSHLYEITARYAQFADDLDTIIANIEAEEIPEDALLDTLDALDGEFEDKADQLCCIIKEKAAFADALDKEMERIAYRKAIAEKEVARLKDYLTMSFGAVGKTKLESPRNKVTFRASKAVMVTDEAAVLRFAYENDRRDLFSIPEPKPKVNKSAIKASIDRGESIPGAYIENKQNIQIK